MNWKSLIQDLMAAGMPQAHIAEAIGLKPPSIIDITKGNQKTVKWDVGDRLLRLHAEHCQKKAA